MPKKEKLTVWAVERHGVEDAYTVAMFSTEELAWAFIEEQEDPYMYGVRDWEVETQLTN